jgi:hypothetical protein
MLGGYFFFIESELDINITNNLSIKKSWLSKIDANQETVLGLMQRLLNAQNPTAEKTVNNINALNSSSRLSDHENIISNIFNLKFNLSENVQNKHLFSSSDQTFHFLQGLIDKGYRVLIQKLALQPDCYPWTHIRQLSHPLLIEQLVSLYSLCLDKKCTKTQEMIHFMFCLVELIPNPLDLSQETSQKIFKNVTQVIGQLIYLVDKNSNLTLKIFEIDNEKEIIKNIKQHFSLAMYAMCDRLYVLFEDHLYTQIQSPEVSLNNAIPLEIASILLIDNGTINSGLINLLSEIFIPRDQLLINPNAHLQDVLKFIQESPEFRATFEKIETPNLVSSLAYDVVRATLQLPIEGKITNFQIRQVILAALLSHLRQGDTSSCFAVSLAIELLSSHLWFCLKDLHQLIQQGKLTRQIDRIYKDIPSVKRISDEDLDKKITFDRQGTLIINYQKMGKLWQAPGIKVACQAIGINEMESAILQIIKNLNLNNKNHLLSLNPRDLIYKLCESITPSSSDLENLYANACFAFSCQTSSALLRVWENAIANMAEAEEGSLLKKKIIDVSLDALQYHLCKKNYLPSRLLQNFFLVIQKQLHHSVQLQYDPTIQNKSSKVAGFVLSVQHERITTPHAFREFIVSLVNNSFQELIPDFSDSNEQQELTKICDLLTSYCHTEAFTVYVLARYHPLNSQLISQLENPYSIPYSKLLFTPWITQIGNNSKAVLRVYFENSSLLESKIFTAQTAEDMLSYIIEMCKHMTVDNKQIFLQNPNQLRPLCILGKHRFPFMAGHASLIQAWQQNSLTHEWIQQHVLNPGQTISQTLISDSMQNYLLQEMEKRILPKFFTPVQLTKDLFFFRSQSLNLTIQEYRDLILNHFHKIYPTPIFLNQLMRQIDTTICQILPPELKQLLENSAIHFADTNWSEGAQDIHFCFVVNPGTGKLELAKCYADKTHLKALDQTYWLTNQQWEFLNFPADLVPENFLNFK